MSTAVRTSAGARSVVGGGGGGGGGEEYEYERGVNNDCFCRQNNCICKLPVHKTLHQTFTQYARD